MRRSRGAKLLHPFLANRAPRLASSIQKRVNGAGSFFISPNLSVDEFNRRLSERAIRAVLLPSFGSAAQLEILIEDDDLDRVDDLITKWPNPNPIKLYSVTGGRREYRFNPPGVRQRANYAVSFLPPHLAEALIGRRMAEATGAQILGPNDAFLTCVYRAAYLEAECWERSGSDWTASVHCETELRILADAAGVSLDPPITPHKLDRLLHEHGWRPSIDLLERTSHWMPWLRDVFPAAEDEEAPGLTLFFIRERAVEAGFQARIAECLRNNGFEPLVVVELDGSQREAAAKEFRGGNWGRGPYRISGGPPATICVALDLLPLEVDEEHRSGFPDSDNRRIVDAKLAARDIVNAGVQKSQHYNPVHSTDNTRQTWRAVRAIIPALEAEVHDSAERLRRDFATEHPVHDLTKHGRRAKVELIEFEGGIAIRKTFRPSALQFMQREIEVMERLAPVCPEIPRLLARGANYIVVENVGDGATPPAKRRPGDSPKPLPLRHVRKLAELIATSLANGFDPIDLRADGNVIYGPSGLKLIDFEFWRPCDPATPPEKSMCLSGIPADDSGNQPRARRRNVEPYRIGWYPHTLLSLRSFLHDPPWLQRIKRAANLANAYADWTTRASFGFAKRNGKKGLRRTVKAAVGLVAPQRTRSAAGP